MEGSSITTLTLKSYYVWGILELGIKQKVSCSAKHGQLNPAFPKIGPYIKPALQNDNYSAIEQY